MQVRSSITARVLTRILVLFVVISTTIGCSASRHDQLVKLGFPTPYLEGYDDGCHSKVTDAKTHQQGFKQNPERMITEPVYAKGWRDGFEQCYVSNKSFH